MSSPSLICMNIKSFAILLLGQGKRAAISKLELFLTEWSRSYFVFALAEIGNSQNSLQLQVIKYYMSNLTAMVPIEK